MKKGPNLILFLIVLSMTSSAWCGEFVPKIVDVTAFKDGHALVISRASAEMDSGWASTKEVPIPLSGALWVYTDGEGSEVDLVRAEFVEQERVKPCMTLEQLIQANIGLEATIVETINDQDYLEHQGTIRGMLFDQKEGGEEPPSPVSLDRWGNSMPSAKPTPSKEPSSFVLLESSGGLLALQRNAIQNVHFRDKDVVTISPDTETYKERELSVKITTDGQLATGTRNIELVYLQKGVRWIPDYRIRLKEGGQASVELQGTIINEIGDFDDVTLRLVVGVPNFLMKGQVSPMSLRQSLPQLSSFLQPPSSPDAESYFLSNALMSQAVSPERSSSRPSESNLPSEGQQEDLFFYTRPNISIEKGASALVSLMRVEQVPYEDVYVWRIPPVPPRETWHYMNPDLQRDFSSLMEKAKTMHEIRLTNTGEEPWTTGPATIFKEGSVLAQELLTYTSIGNDVNLPVTVATDINTRTRDIEVKREEESMKFSGYHYAKVTMKGELFVKNYKDRAVQMVVKREVAGKILDTTPEVKEISTFLNEGSYQRNFPGRAGSWPNWWASVNPISEAVWEITLDQNAEKQFEYTWSYYVRH